MSALVGPGTLLILNAGSSSLRVVAFNWDNLEEVGREALHWDEGSGGEAGRHARAAADLLRGGRWPAPVLAVGHRVVHAGLPGIAARLDARVRDAIAAHADLAPLHNPAALAVMEASEDVLPAAAQVAVFDTGFHATLPPHAYLYAVPLEWHTVLGIRRFGFHGLSHAYCSRRAAELLGRDAMGLRVVTCHLGAGCSLCACLDGRSLTTTMGYTPLDGLMMATRCGALDPGAVLAVLRRGHYDLETLGRVLDQESGLMGVSGVSGDMRAVLTAKAAGAERATWAFDLYISRLRQGIAALAAELGGLDAVVFTGGVGENSAPVRGAALAGLEWMGIQLDAGLNGVATPDTDVATSGSRVRVLVVATREELVAAEATRQLLLSP